MFYAVSVLGTQTEDTFSSKPSIKTVFVSYRSQQKLPTSNSCTRTHFAAAIEVSELEGECLHSQKWAISLVKQAKFKVGVVPADGLDHLLLKTIFEFLSLSMSAGEVKAILIVLHA
jgi:hypothetical protein